jgi:hypothetical protein
MYAANTSTKDDIPADLRKKYEDAGQQQVTK